MSEREVVLRRGSIWCQEGVGIQGINLDLRIGCRKPSGLPSVGDWWSNVVWGQTHQRPEYSITSRLVTLEVVIVSEESSPS